MKCICTARKEERVVYSELLAQFCAFTIDSFLIAWSGSSKCLTAMATTCTGPFTSGVWGPKQYILAATAVTLIVSAVAILTSVVLSPARIVFSVTDVASTNLQVRGGGGAGLVLNFTLDAANPSRRAGVEYSSVIARLRLYSASRRTAGWLQAEVHQSMPLLQPPASSSSFRVSAFFEESFVARNFLGAGAGPAASIKSRGAPPMSVLVVAQVRFRVGLAYSRPYDVQVSCQPVDFFTAAAVAAATRIVCVA